ncbi:MAG: Maf family protein [Desulfobacterales bacterium]
MEPPDVKSKIILASNSPRRRYLLERAGLRFDVIPSRIRESDPGGIPPGQYVRELASAKALDVARRHPESWVIGADTVVVVDGAVMGKPSSDEDARRMLFRLSGRIHEVMTGFCIRRQASGKVFSDTVRTTVQFKELAPAEIDWYIRTGEPFDKAGAYAIQGIGTFLVRRIEGSYTNVVGLPVCEVIEILIREGVLGYDRPYPSPPPADEGGGR